MPNNTMTTVADAWQRVCSRLATMRVEGGYWRGHLASSALSTAVATVALHHLDPPENRELIEAGLRWLSDHANADGGWGDTPTSPANLSTTLLAWSALALAPPADTTFAAASARATAWLQNELGCLEAGAIRKAVLNHYGGDRTFSAPILAMCALSGRLGPESTAWHQVPQLPFELATAPRALFRILRLEVVSYALPALIAIGLLRHRRLPTRNVLRRWFRDRVTRALLAKLRRLQPEHGGFLEAAPLTGFVAMSLAAAGLGDSIPAQRAKEFLRQHVRADGSWPIDTDLATWVTVQAVKALVPTPAPGALPCPGWLTEAAPAIRAWLLSQQHRDVHPFTGARAGGWGWTDRAGAVPDADDTAGALIALRRLTPADAKRPDAVPLGLDWLLDIQNRDGGIPTFCSGWGRLPFDRSCPDLTAHALAAFTGWQDTEPPGKRARRMENATSRAIRYLEETQAADGSWTPLWFGSQQRIDHANPTYGTATVVRALEPLEAQDVPGAAALRANGTTWLLAAQGNDGGWGAGPGLPPSIEETALAIAAIADLAPAECLDAGVEWLVNATDNWQRFPAAPIGLYFASLWYDEQLYPVVFSAAALTALASARHQAVEPGSWSTP